MEKNTAGKWIVFAYGLPNHGSPGLPVTGDAANITANIRIDGAAANAVDDVNPTELEDGYYIFDITAAEVNGDSVLMTPQSSTANVQVIGVPGALWTRPADFSDQPMRGTDSALLAADISLTAGAVDTVTTLTNKTGFSLSTAGILAIWHQLTAAVVTASTMGKLIIDNLNASVSSRMPTTHIDATAGQVDGVALVDVTTLNTDMVGTDNGATAAALATAQLDLDKITGADGATLATAQALYAPAKAGDAMTLTAVATSAQLVADVWNEVLSKASYNTGQSAAKILRQSGDLMQIDGAVSDVSPSTTGFDTDLTQVDGYFKDAVMIFANGSANGGIGKPISVYVNASGRVTFVADLAWPVTPVNGDDFIILAVHEHPIAEIQNGLATSTELAVVDANVDSVLVDTSVSIPALIALLNDVSVSDILTTQMVESYAADGTAPTMAQAFMLIQQMLTEYTITGTNLAVKKLDGSTAAAGMTLNDATNPTGITRSS